MPNKTVAKAPVKTPVAPKKVVSSAPVYKPSMPVSKPMNFSTPGLDLNGVITPKETLKPKINNISFQPFKLSPKIGEVSDITTGIDTTK